MTRFAFLLLVGCSSSPGPVAIDATSDSMTSVDGASDATVDAGLDVATVTILANQQDTPISIATDGTNVYWKNWSCDCGYLPDSGVFYGDGGGTIMTCAAENCGTPTPLVTQGPQTNARGFAIDSSNVYWTADSIRRCTKTGCNDMPSILTANQTWGANGVAVDGASVYWTIADVSGSVMKCPIGACAGNEVVLASKQAGPTSIVVDAQNVYWTNVTNSTVMKCAINGCNDAPTVVASNQASLGGIAVDATDVYWTTLGSIMFPSGSVMKCAVGGCSSPTTIASAQSLPYALALDSTHVYWTTFDGGTVMKCPLTGCGNSPITLATNQMSAVGIAVGDKSVFWTIATQPGRIMRLSPK